MAGHADGLAHVAHGGLDAAGLRGVALVDGQGHDVVGLGGDDAGASAGHGQAQPHEAR